MTYLPTCLLRCEGGANAAKVEQAIADLDAPVILRHVATRLPSIASTIATLLERHNASLASMSHLTPLSPGGVAPPASPDGPGGDATGRAPAGDEERSVAEISCLKSEVSTLEVDLHTAHLNALDASGRRSPASSLGGSNGRESKLSERAASPMDFGSVDEMASALKRTRNLVSQLANQVVALQKENRSLRDASTHHSSGGPDRASQQARSQYSMSQRSHAVSSAVSRLGGDPTAARAPTANMNAPPASEALEVAAVVLAPGSDGGWALCEGAITGGAQTMATKGLAEQEALTAAAAAAHELRKAPTAAPSADDTRQVASRAQLSLAAETPIGATASTAPRRLDDQQDTNILGAQHSPAPPGGTEDDVGGHDSETVLRRAAAAGSASATAVLEALRTLVGLRRELQASHKSAAASLSAALPAYLPASHSSSREGGGGAEGAALIRNHLRAAWAREEQLAESARALESAYIEALREIHTMERVIYAAGKARAAPLGEMPISELREEVCAHAYACGYVWPCVAVHMHVLCMCTHVWLCVGAQCMCTHG